MAQEFLEFELKADTTKAKSNLKSFEEDINATARRLKSKEAIKLSIDVARIKTEIKQTSKEIRKQLKIAEDTGDFTAVIDLEAKNVKLKEQLRGASASLRNFVRTGKKELSVLGKLFSKVGVDVDRFKGKLSGVNSVFKQLGGTILAGLGIREFGRKLKQASDIAVSFESAFAGVEKTINATDEEFKAINKSLRDLTKILPLTFEELSAIAEVGGQLGVGAKDIVEFTKTAAKLGATTVLTAETASTQFAQIATIMQEPISEIDNMGSALVDLGNNFATNEDKILNFSLRIAGAGKIAGLTGAEVLGIATAFTSVGIEAESGGTAVQKTLLTINNAVNEGGVELDKFAVIAGKTAEEFADIWENDAVKGFELFVKGLTDAGDDASQVLSELIGNDIRLARAFLSVANAGDLLNRTIDTSKKAFEENIALQEEFEKRLDTNESKLKIQENRWRLWGNTIGTKVTPELIKINEFLLTAIPTALAGLQNAIVLIAGFFVEKFILLGKTVGTFTRQARIMALNVKDFFIILGKNIGIFVDNVGTNFGNLGAKMGPGLNKALQQINKWVDKVVGKVNAVLEFFGKETITPPQIEFKFDEQTKGKKEYLQYGTSIAGIQAKLDKKALDQFKKQKDREVEINRDALRTNILRRNKELADLKKLEEEATDERKAELEKEIKDKLDIVNDYIEKLKELEENAKGEASKKALEEEKKALEETKRLIEAKGEENKKTYDSIVNDIEKGVDSLEDYIEGVEKVNDKIAELKDDATENIEKINNELGKLDEKRDVKLGKEFVRILEKEKDLKEKLAKEDDSDKRRKIQEELNELSRERNIIIDNTTEAQRKQAEELAKLTKGEIIIQDIAQQKAVLEERKKIYEAIKNGEVINQEEITDFKNKQLAEELAEKQTGLDTELKLLKDKIEEERLALLEINEEKKAFEKDWTKFFGTEIQKQKGFAKDLQRELRRIIALQKEAGIQGASFGTPATADQEAQVESSVDNSRNVDININATNDIDIDLAVEQISEAIQ